MLFAEAVGIDITYDLFDTPPESLGERVQELIAAGYAGFNCTMPLKAEIFKYTHERSEQCRILGVANTIKIAPNGNLSAYTTDGDGMCAGIINSGAMLSQGTSTQGMSSQGMLSQGTLSQGTLSQGTLSQGTSSQGTSSQSTLSQSMLSQDMLSQSTLSQGTSSQGTSSQSTSSQSTLSQGTSHETLRGKSVLVLGAGGTSKAVILSLTELGVRKVTVLNRGEAKLRETEALFENHPQSGILEFRVLSEENLTEAVKCASVIINTSRLGMKGFEQAPDFDPHWNALAHVKAGTAAVDAVYNPIDTAFLQSAKSHGMTVTDGLWMLVYQAALSFEIWTGIKLPLEIVAKAHRLCS
ncbi:hypothetical protein FACS1894105_08930 [Clostridia bacterium]|nr:hypothetical protein FACS1894105_08930 [Clostridia bacterium]